MGQAGQMKSGDGAARRGRGRPRLENPLSAAERARRYRERKRRAIASQNMAEKDTNGAAGLDADLARLKAQLHAHEEFARRSQRELAKLNQENADLRGLVDMFIEARLKRKPISGDVFRNICASYLKK